MRLKIAIPIALLFAAMILSAFAPTCAEAQSLTGTEVQSQSAAGQEAQQSATSVAEFVPRPAHPERIIVGGSGLWATKYLRSYGWDVVVWPVSTHGPTPFRTIHTAKYRWVNGRPTWILVCSLGPKRAPRGGAWRTATASWYGPGFYGRRTASGAVLKRGSMNVAHKTMRFGTKIQFRYRGRTCVAVVNDRGPFIRGRTFDLGPGTAKALRFGGVQRVQWRVVR